MNAENTRIFFLKVLIFVIPFQQWEPFNSPYLNITFLAFFSYTLASVASGTLLFKTDGIKSFLLPLVLLIGIMFYMSYKNYYSGSKIAYSETRQMIMQLVFFWILVNELRRRPKLENELLEVFLWSVVFMAFAFLLRIGVQYKAGRLKIFQANSNVIGLWFVISMFIIVKFLFERWGTTMKRNLFIVCLPLFTAIIALTGSRGAIILLFIGGVVYLFSMKMKMDRKLPIILAGVVALAIAMLFISQVEIVRDRFLMQDEEDLGGRLHIWEAAWPLVVKNPWFGSGASGYERHMAMFFTGDHAPHNIYLTVLLYSGVVGLILFIFFLTRVWSEARKVNRLLSHPFYNVVFIIYIAIFFKAGGLITSFTLWFFLAMIVGGGISSPVLKKYNDAFRYLQWMRSRNMTPKNEANRVQASNQ